MNIVQLNIDGYITRYCFLHGSSDIGPLQQDELTHHLEQIGSSRFYRLSNGSICKLQRDRHTSGSWAWLTKEILERRLLLRASAIREWRSNRKLARLGLRTIPIHAVAIACNPFNPLGCLLIMPWLENMRSGEECFRDADEVERRTLLERVARDVALAARHGYGHRDLHLGNLMIDAQGEILWIDTHLRSLSRCTFRRRQQLCATFHDEKLFGPQYRQMLQNMTLNLFDTKAE